MNFESLTQKNEQTQNPAELFDDAEVVNRYIQDNFEINCKIAELQAKIANFQIEDTVDSTSDTISLEALEQERDRLLNEKISTQANYPGNWTNLLKERMLDPITKEKFIRQRTEALKGLKSGEPGKLDKIKYYFDHYRSQMKEYEYRIESIFNKTNVGTAQENDAKPYHLGSGGIDEVGTVFYDAALRDGAPLTIRQKNIIEAHEKGHGLRDFSSSVDTAEVRNTIDAVALADLAIVYNEKNLEPFPYSYIMKSEEIIERMAQIKNYFGMKGDETFTKEHLAYARLHYIADTGLDNRMSEFFACITPATESTFLEVMNRYPI